MQAIKISASIALVVATASCGGGGGDPDGGPTNWVAPDCTGGAGSGTSLSYVVTGLALPYANDPPVPGFDMDGEAARCGITDFDGSIDNGLAELSSSLDALAFAAGEGDVATVIANAIANEDLVVEIGLEGYDGTGNDDCVLVSLDGGTYGNDVVDAEAAVRDGQVYVYLPEFGLSLPVTSTIAANMDIHQGRAIVDIAAGTGTVGGVANLGSAASYSESEGMAAEEGTVYRAIYTVTSAIGITGLTGIINNAIERASDTNPVPSGTACTGMTVGVTFTAAPVP